MIFFCNFAQNLVYYLNLKKIMKKAVVVIALLSQALGLDCMPIIRPGQGVSDSIRDARLNLRLLKW